MKKEEISTYREEAQKWLEMYIGDPPESDMLEIGSAYRWVNRLMLAGEESQLNEYLGISRINGALFTGPFGSGKHKASEMLARQMGKSCDWMEYICLDGLDLDHPKEAVVLSRVNALFDVSADEAFSENAAAKRFIVFEGLDKCRYSSMVMYRIAEILDGAEIYRDKEDEDGGDGDEEGGEELPVFVVCISEDEKSVHPFLRRKLQLCRFQYANLEERIEFLTQSLVFWKNRGGDNPVSFELEFEGLRVEELAKLTDQFSYCQLIDLVFFIKLEVRRIAIETMSGDHSDTMQDYDYLKMPLEKRVILQLVDEVKSRQPLFPQNVGQIISVVDKPAGLEQGEKPAEARKNKGYIDVEHMTYKDIHEHIMNEEAE